MQKTTVHVKGTHCIACKILLEDVCSEIPGVHASNLNFETGEMVVEHDENLNFENLKNEIEALGDYKVTI